MRNFGEIEKRKDFFISGYIYEDGMASPVEGADEITIKHTREFVKFILESTHHKELVSVLQSMVTKPDGSLLTTWLSIDKFMSFVEEGLNCEKIFKDFDGFGGWHKEDLVPVLLPIFKMLSTETQNWKELGVNEVYFEGYKK